MDTVLGGLRTDLGKGGAGLAQAGDPYDLYTYLTSLGSVVGAPVASLAALKLVAAVDRADGQIRMVVADGSLWRFAATSVLTGDDFLVAAPAAGMGAWIRVDREVDITAAATFATTDTTVLYTVPAGFQLAVPMAYHHVTTSWTGGTSSAIGCSSSGAGLTAQGSLLGGASGDLAASLLSTGAYAKGTIGTLAGKPGGLLVGGDTIRFDRIASAFTAGASTIHVTVRVLLAPAA